MPQFCNKDEVGKTVAIIVGVLAGLAVLIVLLSVCHKALGDDCDSDSEGDTVDGILTSNTKSTYELPSQANLIRRAFAGDDVEDDFEKDKEDVLNEENPEPEKPVLLPGWGQWTHIQKKEGLTLLDGGRA
ncbi:unnamed protein product [Camellia sinensis]